MFIQNLYSKFNQVAGDAFIDVTQFLSRKKWVNTPDQAVEILGQGTYRYKVIRDWCKADPLQYPVNNCHEMVIDSQQRLYLLTDHPNNNIIIFDLNGHVLDSWTLNLNGAHGLTLAQEDIEASTREYLLICDAYHAKVVKTTLDGTLLLTLPTPHELGIYSAGMFYAPTQTTVAPNGDIYVADGYGSQYVIQFNHKGEYIRHFGGKGKKDSNLDFAHGLAIDARKGRSNELLLVTSRVQSCIKQFSLDGHYLGEIRLPGGYPCRPVMHHDHILIGLCWSGAHLKANTGFVIMLDAQNQICATLGGHMEPTGADGSFRLVTDYSCFHHVHDVCADAQGNIYACEWNAGNIYPIKLQRIDTGQ